MAQRTRRTSHGQDEIAIPEITTAVPGYPHWQTRALFVTDPDFSGLGLKRLVIEPADYPKAPPPPRDEPITITALLLRAIRLRDIEVGTHTLFALLSPSPFAPAFAKGAARRKPGRAQDTWDDVNLATLVAEYVELLGPGEPAVVPTLAKRWGKSRSAIATAIKQARTKKRGLLTPALRKGVAGGSLTKKAEKILAAAASGKGEAGRGAR